MRRQQGKIQDEGKKGGAAAVTGGCWWWKSRNQSRVRGDLAGGNVGRRVGRHPVESRRAAHKCYAMTKVAWPRGDGAARELKTGTGNGFMSYGRKDGQSWLRLSFGQD